MGIFCMAKEKKKSVLVFCIPHRSPGYLDRMCLDVMHCKPSRLALMLTLAISFDLLLQAFYFWDLVQFKHVSVLQY